MRDITPAGLALWNANQLLLLFGQEPQLIALTSSYFHYAGLSMAPLLLASVLSQFFAGTNRPKLSMYIALINLPLTIIAMYCFILGRFGMPSLGLAGITCANFMVQSFTVLCILTMLYFRETQYQLFTLPFRPNWAICQSILYLGFPIGIQYGGELAAMTIATYWMGHFGIIALAAAQVVSQYSLFVIVITIGLTQALSILISKAYGQKNVYLIKLYLHASILILLVYSVLVGVLFCLFSNNLILFFVKKAALNAQMNYLGHVFFIIAPFVLLADGIRNLLSGALRGLHDTQAPMRIGIITLWLISLPASYIAGFSLHGGPIWLRIAFGSGFAIAAAMLWRRVQYTLTFIDTKHHHEESL